MQIYFSYSYVYLSYNYYLLNQEIIKQKESEKKTSRARYKKKGGKTIQKWWGDDGATEENF